jgi:hypothetical protein
MKTQLKYGIIALAALLVVSLLVCGGLILPSRAAGGSTIDRPSDPIVLTGADVASLQGLAPGDVVAFRYDGGWVQIPVQVDERDMLDVGEVYNSDPVGIVYLDYTDPDTFAGPDSDPTVDADDEIVLMAKDAGGQAGSAGHPAGVVTGTGVEVAISDPLDAGDAGYVYLFQQAGSLDPGAGQSYVDYQFVLLSGDYKTTYKISKGPNPEDSDVTTSVYGHHFSDRWVNDELTIYAGTGVDILDRHKFQFTPTSCIRTEDTFSSGEGAFYINKSGPVRALRSYMGANSGPYTQRTHLFYQARHDIVQNSRVHEIQGSMDFFDYVPAATGMTYYDNHNTGGVTIDGVPDTVTQGQLEWELIEGAQGALVHAFDIDTNIPSYSSTLYYLDDESPRPNQHKQCTGDSHAYGASGPWIDHSIPCTDPAKSCPYYIRSYRYLYYDAPGLTVTDAVALRNQALNPLTVATQAWNGGGPSPTDTPVPPPTDTPVPPTDTPVPPPTETPEPGPTDTPAPPTDTPLPPTDTPIPPTDTPVPPTDTPAPTSTPGGATVMHVEDIYTTDEYGTPKDVFNKKETVYYQVLIEDQGGAPVDGATVTCDILWPNDQVWVTQNSDTGADGWAYFDKKTLQNNPLGVYTIDVTNVVKSGATYDAGANVKDSHQFTLQ